LSARLAPPRGASWREVTSSAAIGARVGILFAALEAICATYLGRMLLDGTVYLPCRAEDLGLSIAAHALAGALVGIATAFAVARHGGVTDRAVVRTATFAAAGALAANALAQLPKPDLETNYVALGGLIVMPAMLATWAYPATKRYLEGLRGPWPIALALVVVPWISRVPLAEEGLALRIGVLAGSCAVLVALARLLRQRIESPAATGTALTFAGVALALCGSLLRQATIRHDPTSAKAPSSTNVIVLSLDTVRADHLSLYGYERDTTPFLKELAQRATLFTRSYSASDLTLTSHASLFTGQYARNHGVHPLRELPALAAPELAPESRTLAQILSDRGWQTIGVVANFGFLGTQFGLHRGFRVYDARARELPFRAAPEITLRWRLQRWLYPLLPPRLFDLIYVDADTVRERIVAELEAAHPSETGRPFFLFANFMDAHMPYSPPEPFASRFAGDAAPLRRPPYYELRERVYAGLEPVGADERAELIARYDGALAYLDDGLRRLFGDLERLGLLDTTLVVVTADHGEAFGEHSTLEHGMSVQEEQIRVPLLVLRPGRNDPERRDDLASGIDLVPTVLRELGLDLPDGLDGRALFGSEPDAGRIVYAEHYPYDWHVGANPRRAVHETAALFREWKWIRPDDGSSRIHDLAQDPGEERTLEAPPPGTPDLERELQRWKHVPSADRRRRGRSGEALDALGYGD
jgi:arylsulfatase A-like enzyme